MHIYTFGVFGIFSLALAVVGCTPLASSAGPDPDGGTTTGLPGATSTREIAEIEPNNGPDLSGMQGVGTLDGTSVKISGKLDSGGVDGERYAGDFDGFVFEISAGGGKLAASIDWGGDADVDAILYDANLNPLSGDNSTAKPISNADVIPAGKYALVLFSKDKPASYTITLRHEKGSGAAPGGGGAAPGGTDCIDSNTLSGGYWQATTGGLSEIRFKQNGGVDLGSANPVSGTVWASGSWSLSCPTLTAQIKNPGGSMVFTVNGKKLVQDNGRIWVRCEPISNGECF